MHRRFPLAMTVLLLAGCGHKPASEAPSSPETEQPLRVEVGIGGSEDVTQGCLPFTITARYDNHEPSTEAPFHVQGGEWTFFDCRAELEPETRFTVGVRTKREPEGSSPFGWGSAVLIVQDREAGGGFLELFGRSFPGMIPKPIDQPYVPTPLFLDTAILGRSLERETEGGFSGSEGDWTATKWFLERDGYYAEVFFNYNLSGQEGEFSEKDVDYADDLLAILASALRDGPRPERTPETDPNLSRIGPTIGHLRRLLPRSAAYYCFSPDGRHAVFQDRSVVFALSLEEPDGAVSEIARFDHSPWTIHVVNEKLDLLVQEGIPEQPGARSSSDPMRIWWVDHKTGKKTLLRGPEKDIDLDEVPISPERRFVALHQWKARPEGRGRIRLLLILDRESGEIESFEPQDGGLSVVGWRETDSGVRAVAVTNRWRFDENERSELYLADPATGSLERLEQEDARFEIDNPLSPDGKRRFRIGENELIVIDTEDEKERRFLFHEDDRRFVGEECVEWAGSRYLKFDTPRLALIDVTTMKMCYPASADDLEFSSYACTFSADFHWMLYQGEGIDGEGLFLAPVQMSKGE